MAKVNEYIPIHYVGRRNPVTVCTGPDTIVEQCHEETTNINKIIARYRTGGQLPEYREGQYLDVSEVGEFHEVRLQMNAALAAYDDLPESITSQFKDAGEFIEYAERQRQAAAAATNPEIAGQPPANPEESINTSPPPKPPESPPSAE